MKTQTKPKETQAIQMMPVGQLRQHPQNPRKDLGDLSELTDSIRENGILQNLTITPWIGEVTGDVLAYCWDLRISCCWCWSFWN